jgi:hypothetical protein
VAGLAWLDRAQRVRPGQSIRAAIHNGPAMLLPFACDAGLMVASGLIHLHLWDIAYRHVRTLDVLFLVQVIAALLLAVAPVVTRHLLAVTASFVLMAGTIVGIILARTVGIFGFKLGFSSGLANTVLDIEIAAVVLLAVTGWLVRGSVGRTG